MATFTFIKSRAKLYNPDVRTCKMTEAKILEEDTDSAASGS